MEHMISADNSWALFAILATIAALAIWMEQRFRWASRITGCVIALLMAMILSNAGIIPMKAPAYDFVWDYVVPMAVPMLLFNANIREIGKESGRLLIIFLISGAGTVLGGFIAFSFLKNTVSDLAEVTPMMIGTYTGGSINLVAMSEAFHVSGELVSASVIADNLIMAFYFVLLMMISASGFLLRRFRHPLIDAQQMRKDTKGAEAYWKAKPVSLKDIAFSCSVSLLIVAVSNAASGVFSKVIPKSGFFMNLLNGMVGSRYLVMTTVTVILATVFSKQLGSIGGAQEIGTYLIYIFFAVIGVPASLSSIVMKFPLLLLFCLIIVLINLAVTLLFGRIFHFSMEEILIASNANIGGPTTAAAMAIAKGWNSLIVSAILVGTLGYVLGNYYGVLSGTLLGL